MKKRFKLGICGAGFMSSAIIKGIFTSKKIKTKNILVSDISESALNNVSKYGVKTTNDNNFLFENCDFILFAVKPQTFPAIAENNKFKNLKIISIMAGVQKKKIHKYFKNSLVARLMPNTPCSIGYGAIGLDASEFSEKSDLVFINNVLSPLGNIVNLDEKHLNAVTGISGSSPAYFYLFAKYLIEAGVENGLSLQDSKKLVVSTMLGSAKMIEMNNDVSIDELINRVCSKGGTTIQAVNYFNNNKLSIIEKNAVKACIDRAKELENS